MKVIELSRSRSFIKREEGLSLTKYKDSEGYAIGYGYNVLFNKLPDKISKYFAKRGKITERMANELLEKKMQSIINHDMKKFSKYNEHSSYNFILINMIYQLGRNNVLGFPNMLKSMLKNHDISVYKEMMDSVWYRDQTPYRVQELILHDAFYRDNWKFVVNQATNTSKFWAKHKYSKKNMVSWSQEAKKLISQARANLLLSSGESDYNILEEKGERNMGGLFDSIDNVLTAAPEPVTDTGYDYVDIVAPSGDKSGWLSFPILTKEYWIDVVDKFRKYLGQGWEKAGNFTKEQGQHLLSLLKSFVPQPVLTLLKKSKQLGAFIWKVAKYIVTNRVTAAIVAIGLAIFVKTLIVEYTMYFNAHREKYSDEKVYNHYIVNKHNLVLDDRLITAEEESILLAMSAVYGDDTPVIRLKRSCDFGDLSNGSFIDYSTIDCVEGLNIRQKNYIVNMVEKIIDKNKFDLPKEVIRGVGYNTVGIVPEMEELVDLDSKFQNSISIAMETFFPNIDLTVNDIRILLSCRMRPITIKEA